MMRFRVYAAVTLVAIVSLIVMGVLGAGHKYVIVAAIMALFFSVLTLRAVAKPLDAVQNGLYLIKAEDFGSRLRPTGQHDADKVVSLFNSMIDALKAERLKGREQERFLSQLIAVSPMGIAICDFNGKIVSHNKAWANLMTVVVEQGVKTLAPGESVTLRQPGPLVVRLSRLWFMDRGFHRTFYLAEPMTEAIADAEKRLFNHAIRTIGHEVNNTMGSVMSVLESVLPDTDADSMAAAAVRGCSDRCDSLVKFVRAYADIAKLPSPEPVPADLASWLEDMMPALKSLAPANVGVHLSINAGDHVVEIDTMLMERVLTNIVKNSIESIGDRPDGAITISVGGGELTVTDNGQGISSDNVAKLFTPFFTTKRSDRGLGLMLVSDILRGHKARFSLTTDPDSGLTSFRIVFNRRYSNFNI